MSFRHARHFARIYNTPLLIAPGALDAMLPALEAALRGQVLAPGALRATPTERTEQSNLPAVNGVAVLPIHGVLAHRSMLDAECNFLLGYQTIAQMLDAVLADPEIHSIVLDLDSPGGEVAGCFDLVEHVRAVSATKPVYAAVNDQACSAAYAIASACRSISVTRTASVGSVGVRAMHVDMSQWLENEGYKVTHIYAGANKLDGDPYAPLPADVRARFQRDIDTLYGLFVETVAAGRSISAEAVRGTQADVYRGQAGIDVGLADRIETPDALIQRLAVSTAGLLFTAPVAATTERPTMASDDQAATPAATTCSASTAPGITQGITQADLEAAEQLGRETERERILGILTHAEATERERVAINLARVEAMTPDAAAAVLAAMPKASGANANNAFATHMQQLQTGQEVGPDEPDDPEAAVDALWSRAIARVTQ